MADFVNETQASERRISDTKTGRDFTAPVNEQSLTVADHERHLRTEHGDIATYDGTVQPATSPELAFCRTCNNGPFSTDAVARCTCGTMTCKRCGTRHDGSWLCWSCNLKRILRAVRKVLIGV